MKARLVMVHSINNIFSGRWEGDHGVKKYVWPEVEWMYVMLIRRGRDAAIVYRRR